MSAGSVLVVDDNPLIVNILQGLLQSENYNVHVSRNGKEALQCIESKEVDVVVCDVMMPEMDGYQFLQEFRKDKHHTHVPFVFLTALGHEDEKLKGHTSGADDYLIKPFDPRELLAVIQGKVERSRALRAQSADVQDQYKRRVIQTLSHEFRTPLVAISTGAELLLGASEQLADDKVRGLIEAIQRGGMRLERLVNDFMLMQQIEAGLVQKVFDNRAVPLPTNDLSQELEVLSQSELIPGMHLSVFRDTLVGKVKVHSPHILEAWRRLVENAMKFASEKKRIEVRFYETEKVFNAEVIDWGIGINPIKVQEMKELFGQIDRDLHEQQGGGFGLSIASVLAQINQGELFIDSVQDELPKVMNAIDQKISFLGNATKVIISIPLLNA